MPTTPNKLTRMGIFFLTRGGSAIVYSQLLTYLKTPSQLVCYGITIAGWYLVAICNSVERVRAGEVATQDERSIEVPRSLLPPPTPPL